MRYRYLRYRYAWVVMGAEPRPWGSSWRAEPTRVVLAQPRWRPPADVYETPTTIGVTVELAGVDHDDLDILLFDDALVIEGERRLPPPEEEGIYHTAEINQGRFQLVVPLPAPIDAEQVDARYDRGLLQITLGKATER